MSIAGHRIAQGRNSLLEASVNQFGIICQNLLKLSTHFAIKMLSLPKRTQEIAYQIAPWHDYSYLAVREANSLHPNFQMIRKVQSWSSDKKPAICSSIPILSKFFPSTTTLEELFDTMVKKQKIASPISMFLKLWHNYCHERKVFQPDWATT